MNSGKFTDLLSLRRVASGAAFAAMLLVGTSSGSAQPANLPLLSGGNSQLAISAVGGMSRHDINGYRVVNEIASLRPTLGFWNRFDGFAILGIARQKTTDAGVESVSGTVPALGLGLAVRPQVRLPSQLELAIGIQRFRYKPESTTSEGNTQGVVTFERKRLSNYTWDVVQATMALSRRVGRLELFLGGEWLSEQVDRTNTMFLISNGDEVMLSRDEGLFFRRSRVGINAGFLIALPNNHQFGVQIRGSGSGDFGMYLGISQTGATNK